MAIIPLRSIGKQGVITDLDPFSPAPDTVSFAKNVRIADGSIHRGSVFRTVSTLAGDPGHIFSYLTNTGALVTLIVRRDGKVYEYSAGTETDKSLPAWVASTTDDPITVCEVNNIVYVNREDRVPWYRSKGSSGNFAEITLGATQWDSTKRCKSLRAFKGMLMAFHITDGANIYPNMIKWSDFTSHDALPADWDEGSTTSSAGENLLDEMKGHILDAHQLRNRMMIYGTDETWFAEYVGGNDIFRWDRAFNTGVINVNCVTEHNGVHYVFGDRDLSVNDGYNTKSIASGRVRRFIFDTMRYGDRGIFFTAHNPLMNEVIFCYSSEDEYCAFAPSSTGCNRGAVYNYEHDTWYFVDLPYVTHSGFILASGVLTYDTATTTYETIGSTFAALEGDSKYVLVFPSIAGTTTARALRTFEHVNSSATPYALDADATQGAYIERVGIDLDEIKSQLSGYKLVSSVFPQCRLGSDAEALNFTIGISDYASEEPYWGTSQTFDQLTYYKLDFNQAGRFLAYRIEQDDAGDFKLSGFDVDVTLLGTF